ncbi:hypothetical protein OEZ85_011108 [Tetradesmus obliquus]|uniref:Cupin 2 conserved barrel domain-containing protein n=1 Tax=Tetradesmus obliquus TaxID=3088 RepID=A0ABY8TP93_TETOB|nr:hypothetical protein OEZ85_011108 [Tetradesmus obliquus]
MSKVWGPALLLVACLGAVLCDNQCENPQKDAQYSYEHVFSSARDKGVNFWDLPGYSRSVYAEDHALLTPESRVWAPNTYGWHNSMTAHLITPAKGPHFTMYLVQMKQDSKASQLDPKVERFVFMVEGNVQVKHDGKAIDLAANDYAYFPPGSNDTLTSAKGAGLCVFERVYSKKGKPAFQHGTTDDRPVLPVAPEVFVLRKLLPASDEFDFNIHVMDFEPGQYLYVKEIHYNQHGLLLLQGQGIYRLGNNWYPVQAGDAIWMPPFVLQWYAALGNQSSRYLLYKDTNLDPLLSP